MKEAPWLLAPEGELEQGSRVVLDSMEARHAGGPLRLETGARVVLTDGAGSVASGTLVLKPRGAAEVDVETSQKVERPSCGISLAMALLAGPAMDLVVQKAVELGVDRLTPVWCTRSQIGLKRAATRSDHWLRISRQALKQCRRPWAMEMAQPVTLANLLEQANPAHGVVADPGGGTVDELPRSRERVLLIGPEGGFSADEEGLIRSSGWSRLKLGAHVLRAETAAIAGVAVLSTADHRLHSTDD